MRWAVFGVSAVLAASLLSGCGKEKAAKAPAGPVEKPVRKAGLWEQTVLIEGMQPQHIRICADPAVEGSLPWWGRVVQDGKCTDIAGKRQPNGSWSFESRCEMGPAGTSGIRGTATGDFNSSYQVNVQINTAGANNPQLNGPRKLSNSFVWKGACPADWHPGDVEVAGGTRMNADPTQVAAEIARAEAALKAQAAEQK